MQELEIILIAFLSGITTLLGVWLATLIKERKKLICMGIGFSVGIMLAISFLELVPLAFEKVGNAFNGFGNLVIMLCFSAGFILVWLFDFFFPHTHFTKEKGHCTIMKTCYLVAFGIIIHDFPEGFAVATSYTIKTTTGLLIALGVALHNIPEGFALGVPLVLSKEKKTLYRLGFISSLAEPAGAIIGLIALAGMPGLAPYFMAFAAGAMVFVSLDELLPLSRQYGKTHYSSLGLLFGILLFSLLSFLLPG
mgnify:CR=1 FL=1